VQSSVLVTTPNIRCSDPGHSLAFQQIEVYGNRVGRCPERERARGGDLTPPDSSRGGAEQETRRECCVCLERPATHVMVPCGHVCVCEVCEALVTDGDGLCPLCRADVTTAVKVFF